MKTKTNALIEETIGAKTVSIERAKEIMREEGIEYTDEELKQVLDFISKIISITTSHFERAKEKQAKIISINSNNSTDETKSIPLHTGKYRRTG